MSGALVDGIEESCGPRAGEFTKILNCVQQNYEARGNSFHFVVYLGDK